MQIKAEKNNIDLKTFISEKLKISRSKAKSLIDTKNIFVNKKRTWIATFLLKKGDIISIPDIDLIKKESNIEIIYRDDFIIAVNKPAGIITDKTSDSFESQLKNFLNNENIKAIHRLDKETSGVLLFAKNNKIFETFKNLWKEKKVKKIYLSICHHVADFNKKEIKFPVNDKPAESFIEKISSENGLTLFKIITKTGRKHQIRIHLAKIGFPIVGDKIYGPSFIKEENLRNVKRHLLHCYELSYPCPFTKKNIIIKAKLPDDFLVFKNLMKEGKLL